MIPTRKGTNRPRNDVAVIAFSAMLLMSAGPQPARAYSQRVNNACSGDYQQFCSSYAPGTTQLRRCMESNRSALSKRCIDALIDAGEVPRRYRKR